jgi:hypothetical protein
MKIALYAISGIVLLTIAVVNVTILLTPWMDTWKTTPQERSYSFPGDDLLKDPARIANRAVTINASPAQVFPWIVQMGADKAGMYSYTWLERLFGCKMAKDEIIRSEWQSLQEGDLMHMCAGEKAPPPYIVVKIIPDQAVVFGHQENGEWVDLWAFVLIPQTNNTTRLVTHTRTMMVGGAWEVFNRLAFVMERKMLLTIKALSE